MLIVDPDSTPFEVFKHGFWKGLSAPLSCYLQYELPPLEVEKTDLLERVNLRLKRNSLCPLHKSAAEALRSDWEKVGQDIRCAIQQYEEQI
jgi:hypothetical protein